MDTSSVDDLTEKLSATRIDTPAPTQPNNTTPSKSSSSTGTAGYPQSPGSPYATTKSSNNNNNNNTSADSTSSVQPNTSKSTRQKKTNPTSLPATPQDSPDKLKVLLDQRIDGAKYLDNSSSNINNIINNNNNNKGTKSEKAKLSINIYIPDDYIFVNEKLNAEYLSDLGATTLNLDHLPAEITTRKNYEGTILYKDTNSHTKHEDNMWKQNRAYNVTHLRTCGFGTGTYPDTVNLEVIREGKRNLRISRSDFVERLRDRHVAGWVNSNMRSSHLFDVVSKIKCRHELKNIMSAMVNTDFLVRAREDKCSQIHIDFIQNNYKRFREDLANGKTPGKKLEAELREAIDHLKHKDYMLRFRYAGQKLQSDVAEVGDENFRELLSNKKILVRPSYNRPTIATFDIQHHERHTQLVQLIFVNGHEFDMYETIWANYCVIIKLPCDDLGIGFARNIAFNFVPRDVFAFVDDTIYQVRTLTDPTSTAVPPSPSTTTSKTSTEKDTTRVSFAKCYERLEEIMLSDPRYKNCVMISPIADQRRPSRSGLIVGYSQKFVLVNKRLMMTGHLQYMPSLVKLEAQHRGFKCLRMSEYLVDKVRGAPGGADYATKTPVSVGRQAKGDLRSSSADMRTRASQLEATARSLRAQADEIDAEESSSSGGHDIRAEAI